MKIYYLKALTLMLCLLIGITVHAHDFEVGGIYYNITSSTNKTVSVTYQGSSYSESIEYNGEITIPEIVTYNNVEYCVVAIGESAFYGCDGLTGIIIPNSVTCIGSNPFSGCTGLESIIVESGNAVYDSRNNCNAIIETLTNTLITGCKNTTIPNSVTSIGDYAFYGCIGLTSVTLGNSVTSIGKSAFYSCDGLTSVTIPNSVTLIEKWAFYNCKSLNVEICNEDGGVNIQPVAFESTAKIKYLGKDAKVTIQTKSEKEETEPKKKGFFARLFGK